MPSLFDSLKLGALTLPNRIVMAPLTRARAGDSRIPNALMAEYYAQRADAGLILSEATSIMPMGVGYAATPGIWSAEQVEGWKLVTDAVHRAGGRIFMQLWHVGRISDPSFLGGEPPVAPSAIAAEGHVSLLRPLRPFPVPRALETDEIPGIVAAYRQAAANARKANFDGVEIHGANGYLLDQFLEDSTNRRTDAYGGPVENRARLMLEAVDAAIAEWGADRVGLHLSPRGEAHDMGDANPVATFGYVAEQMKRRGIAFIFAREHMGPGRIGPLLKQVFGGAFIANENLTKASAQVLLESGEADAASFGKAYIANPDLVRRLAEDAPLNALDMDTLYGDGAKGYTDYPFLP